MFAAQLANPELRAFAFASLAFLIAVVLTPIVIRVASNLKFFDIPGQRKIHGRPIPRLGGIAIFFALWVSWLLFVSIFPHVVPYEGRAPMNAILGVMRIADVHDLAALKAKEIDAPNTLTEPERSVLKSPWAFGPFCWRIDRIWLLDAPIPCRGALSLWETPDEIGAALEGALKGEPGRAP